MLFHNNSVSSRTVASLVLLVFVSGCGSSEFDIAPVRGKVTIDGKAMPGGQIRFAPIPTPGESISGKSGFSLIREDGTFELGTDSATDGAVVGEHWVTVYSYNPRLGDGKIPPDAKFERYSVPDRKTVEPTGENVIDIDISSNTIGKYGVPVRAASGD